MFTGIVSAVGNIADIDHQGADRCLMIEPGKLDVSDVRAGDSISISGVCLTVTSIEMAGFRVDVSSETLSCTTFGNLARGDRVNLEKAMQLGDRLGGHLVSGHVDGLGRIAGRREDARSVVFDIEITSGLSRYICRKGSVCVDGVSLTVNSVGDTGFSVNIIPYTLGETTFSDYRDGTQVNIEVDIIARYLERLAATRL